MRKHFISCNWLYYTCLPHSIVCCLCFSLCYFVTLFVKERAPVGAKKMSIISSDQNPALDPFNLSDERVFQNHALDPFNLPDERGLQSFGSPSIALNSQYKPRKHFTHKHHTHQQRKLLYIQNRHTLLVTHV